MGNSKIDIKQRVLNSYNQQAFMKLLGAEIVKLESGLVVIECPYKSVLTQQHGFLHAGVVTTLMDVACGYAALSTMPEGKEVLSVEFKTTLMRPAKADIFRAVGKVVKPGKRLTFCEGVIMDKETDKEFARMTATMICVDINPLG